MSGSLGMKIVSCTSTFNIDNIFQVSIQSLEKCGSSSLHKLRLPLYTIWLSSRAHNSGMSESLGMKIVSCTSTLHGDNIFQVSLSLLKECGSSLLHKLVMFYANGPTDQLTDKVNPIYPLSNFVYGGYNNIIYHACYLLHHNIFLQVLCTN